MPEWARAYVETGELPTYDTPEHDQWVGWAFFDESIPGLPDERTPEGKALAWGRYRADQAS
jgi:hypothetical protein